MLGKGVVVLVASSLLSVTLGQSEGDVRLTGASTPRYGRLEIFWQGKWGTFCELSETGGDAACRQLGFKSSSRVLRYSSVSGGIPRAGDDVPIALGSSSCGSSEIHVLRCSYSADTSACSHDQDIVLDCCSHPQITDYKCDLDRDPYNTQVRLVSNTFPSTGTLEIYINQQWGNVCYDKFDQGAADSTCRQLGYTNALTLTSTNTLTSSCVWLSGIQCGSTSKECLRCCFDTQPNVPTTCPGNNYLVLWCTFDTTKAETMSSPDGVLNTCKYSGDCNNSWNGDDTDTNIYLAIFIPVGVIGFMFICVCLVISCVIGVCVCVGVKKSELKCCKRRRRPGYNIIHHPDDMAVNDDAQ